MACISAMYQVWVVTRDETCVKASEGICPFFTFDEEFRNLVDPISTAMVTRHTLTHVPGSPGLPRCFESGVIAKATKSP